MAFDFKKEYKDLYLPKTKPELIDVPPMSFIAVAGTGNPNEENGSYADAMGLLYAFSYTIKMSKMGAWQPDGYFDYTVPPLEGLWWTSDEAFDGQRILDKDALSWISLIRQPDFVTPEVFAWAAEQVAAKKPELDLRRLLEEYKEPIKLTKFEYEYLKVAKKEGFNFIASLNLHIFRNEMNFQSINRKARILL